MNIEAAFALSEQENLQDYVSDWIDAKHFNVVIE